MSAAMVALLAACGARTSLLTSGASSGPGESSSTGERGGSGGTGGGDGAGGGGGAEPKCLGNPAKDWEIERYRDQGDYERTAVAVSGQPWAALKVKDGNVILVSLDIDPAQGIVFTDKVEVANSPVYPVALDLDDRRFVMLTTTGINWNGELDLWRIDRLDGSVIQLPILTGDDPNSVLIWSVALAGDDIVIGRGAAVDGQGTVELRDDQLNVLQSLDVPAFGFTAVKSGPAAVDVYCQNGNVRVHAEAQALTQTPTNPKWPVIGGLDPFLLEMGAKIRLTEHGGYSYAPWPDTQISPPAIIRTHGPWPAVVLETELTAVVGHIYAGDFRWMPIIPTDDAPGTGLGLLPKIDKNHLGLFYLGLEIPSPQQPLRYFGRVCK